MASRRQELSQRRKAVGFTQESLAEHLGVERSTVIRWEAGDSEPLPSIRPNLARALQLSIDQLADLLTKSETAGTAAPGSAEPRVEIPPLLPEVPLPGRSDEVGLENLIQPQIAETVEALRQALRAAGVTAEDLAAMLLMGGSSAAPLRVPGPDVETPHAQKRRARSRERKRLVAASAFALVLPVALLSAPFAQGGANSQFIGGAPKPTVPVDAIPAPNPGAAHDNPVDADTTPSVTSNPPLAQPAVGPPPASEATQAPGTSLNASRSAATTRHPVPRTPAEMMARAGLGQRFAGFGQIERFDHMGMDSW